MERAIDEKVFWIHSLVQFNQQRKSGLPGNKLTTKSSLHADLQVHNFHLAISLCLIQLMPYLAFATFLGGAIIFVDFIQLKSYNITYLLLAQFSYCCCSSTMLQYTCFCPSVAADALVWLLLLLCRNCHSVTAACTVYRISSYSFWKKKSWKKKFKMAA